MKSKYIVKICIVLLIVVANIGCDQASKKIVRNKVQPYERIEVLGNHLTITNVENSGAFLSIGDSLPKSVRNILLSLVPLIAILFGFGYVIKKQNIPKVFLVALCFIIGGGIGNIFDRICYGSVTDFLYLHAGSLHTGIFNLADVSITVGVVVLIGISIFKRKHAHLS